MTARSPFDVERCAPPPMKWGIPPTEEWSDDDLVVLGADLEPSTLLAAYRRGLFPMPIERNRFVGPGIGWWSPDPRGIIPLDGLRISRSLRRSCRRYEIRWDTAFGTVVHRCADPTRSHGWINDEFRHAYEELHRLGWAHSVEAWLGEELVGGLYGVHINGLFAGESMFHSAVDASKVALVALVEAMRSAGLVLLDVQWLTPHLASLGAIEVSRAEYLELLAHALAQ
jgi:leucyl/phenylalanyl-tRNA---protein transferase